VSKVKVAECLLVQVWKRQLVEKGRMVTDSGERLQVIYPGRENKDSGPDFIGAIISTADGVLLRGDVELHSRAGDWKSHGHNRDPGYNDVILQVVWDGDRAAELQSGKKVPTLSLRHCLKGSLDDVRYWADLPMVPSGPCYNAGQRLGDSEMGRLLDEAGEERFRLKTGHFAEAMGKRLPSQVLFEGIMGALGYSKNKEFFEELARCLPLAVLEGFCLGKPPQEQVKVLKALLLGRAGLLVVGGDGELERIWSCLGDGEAMDSSLWRVFRVRPENHPARRLVGAAYLLARFMEAGLSERVLQLVGQARPGTSWLDSSFMVSAPEPCSGNECSLIGQGRAREIVINIILPFVLAWAEARSQEKLEEQVLALYQGYPKAGEYGITRDLAKLLLGPGASRLVNSARRQQGLVHLDKTFCRRRECACCPVARRLTLGLLAS
jgi:hypothetical protein